ncbi:DUF5690 family protein [Pseudobythopirellula maris]|uniref:DUF5690 family protein n=1 Tax=Pseudobythopirellula maris TaxID=2527991 RepID=UPI0011B71CAB|nr:DUF5690 family protein [Pseudobythopirellula maris]
MTRWLERRSGGVLNLFAIATAFSAYFCMYAFRKPFAAASFVGDAPLFFGQPIEQKTLLVVSQILGYALSKYLGVWVCSETGRRWRFAMLIGLILAAEGALVLFGLAPNGSPYLKAAAIFLNGLPLGMVWGLVVLYLEGRRVSELLLTGLSCAYIVASGVVKDVGRAVLAGADFPLPTPESWGLALPNPLPPVGEYWMPAVTGALFLAPFVLSTWLLEQIPEPTDADRGARTAREPMGHAARRRFASRYATGICAALAAYFLLTAFRDYRDNYVVEIFTQLGYQYDAHRSIVSNAELFVAFGVMAVLSQLYRISDNRRGLVATFGVMTLGLVMVAAATLLLDLGLLSGFWWVTLIGLGAYLAYVPFGSVLFDRVIAQTGFVGTAVFGIYLADAVGYTGSVALQLGKDLTVRGATELDFLRMLAYVLGTIGAAGLIFSCVAFMRQTKGSAAAEILSGPPAGVKPSVESI